MKPRTEVCSEKARLTEVYDSATAQFSRLLSNLNDKTGIVSKAEYQRLREAVEAARLASERARTELERHVAEHRC